MSDPKVNIKVSAETAQAKKALAEVKSALNEMKNLTKGALGAFGLGFGIRELLNIADEASKAQREMASLNAVMKNAGYPAEAAASLEQTREELSAITIASKDALVTVQKLLIGLKVPYNFIEPFTKLALDLAAFENISPSEAAAKLGRAISSNSAELRGYGIQIDDTLPKAEKLEQLIAQLTSRFDGLARSSFLAGGHGLDTARKSIEELKDAIGDLLNEVANAFFEEKIADNIISENYLTDKNNLVRQLKDQFKAGALSADQYQRYLDSIIRSEQKYAREKKLIDQIRKGEAKIEDIAGTADEFGRPIQEITMLSAADQAQKLRDDFLNRFRAIKDQFSSEADKSIIQPIVKPEEKKTDFSKLGADSIKALVESEYDLQKITLELGKVKAEMLKNDLTAEEYANRRKEIASAELEITKEMLQNKMESLMKDRDKVLNSELEPAQKRNELEKIYAQLIDLSAKERQAAIQYSIEELNIEKEKLESAQNRSEEELEIAKMLAKVRSEVAAQNLKNTWKGGVEDFWQWTNTVQLQSTIVASALTGVVGNAITGISDGIMGLIDGTKSWGESMQAMGRLILQTLIQVAVQMMVIGAIRSVLGGPGRGFWGMVGFDEGGLVPGTPSSRDNRIASVATGEYVMQSKAVQHYGAGYMEALNQMRLPKAGFGIPPSMPVNSFASGGLVGSSAVNVTPAPVNVVVLKDQRELKQYLESTEGRKVLYSMVNGMKLDLGMRS